MTAIPVRWLTVFLDFPAGSFGAGVAFWREVTGSTLSPFRGATGEFATLLPPSGDAYLRVQRVAGGSGGHHLDLHVDPAAASVEQAAERAVALGAKVLHRELGLVILASPGGFTFCLVRWHGEGSVPGPVRLDGAGTSRADQFWLDAPASEVERERSFWTALTGWEGQGGARSAQPVRLELRRAGLDDRVTGHLAFACADRERLAARHAAAGARILAVLPHETEMADPADRFYRLTDDSAADRAMTVDVTVKTVERPYRGAGVLVTGDTDRRLADVDSDGEGDEEGVARLRARRGNGY